MNLIQLVAAASLAFATPVAAQTVGSKAALPLRVSHTGRFLVDQKNEPFLVVGDTPWSLIVQLDQSNIVRYLDDRQRRGFNSIIVNLLEHKFCTAPPKTRLGLAPFVTSGDFSTPKGEYFDWAHQVVELAHQRGIVVWLAPAYLGYGGGDEGFFREIKSGGKEKLRSYGRFVGEKFKDLPNIVWLLGGDYTPPEEDRWVVRELALGIGEKDATHLITVHDSPENSAVAIFGHEPWLSVDTVYSYEKKLFRPLLAEFALHPAKPFVLIETTYEGEHDSTPDVIRRQAYWAMLGGACGQFVGNNPIWHFDGPGLFATKLNWIEAMDAAGSRDMMQLRALFLQLPWWELVPEENHAIVTAGYGVDVATALTASTPDRKLSVTYIPSTGSDARELTVDASKLAGAFTSRWYNPVTGTFIPASALNRTEQNHFRFRSPGDNGTRANDWVLVLQTQNASSAPKH